MYNLFLSFLIYKALFSPIKKGAFTLPFDLKNMIYQNKSNSKKLIFALKKDLIKKYKIKIEYLECRNLINLGTNLDTKSFKLFVAYYLNKVRLIDNF